MKDTVTRKDAFTVKKGALSASPSARVEILAKPTAPRSPVERRPPREKDKYGRPIFEIPVRFQFSTDNELLIYFIHHLAPKPAFNFISGV